MRTLVIVTVWIVLAAIVLGVGFGPAGLLRDASVGTLGIGLLGAACLLHARRWASADQDASTSASTAQA
jgi:hypothetical protein